MINEIKIDRSKPVLANVSNKGSGTYLRTYLFTVNKKHFCERHVSELPNRSNITAWDNIEFIKEKKRVPLDAKSCPRRPVLTHSGWDEGVECYPHICELGLKCDAIFYPWETLFKGDYKINGQPASREVDE